MTPYALAEISFRVTATGTPPFSYQWYNNYLGYISGATDSVYTIQNMSANGIILIILIIVLLVMLAEVH